MLCMIFLGVGYHVGQARSVDLAAYDAEVEAEAPGAGDVTQETPQVPLDRLADAGDGQALTSDPAPGGASAAAVSLTRAAAAPGEPYAPGDHAMMWGEPGRWLPGGRPSVSIAMGRSLLIALRKADMSTELFRSPLIVVTRYGGPDLGPEYERGRVQITLGGHTDAGLPRQIGMTYAHWAQLAAAVEQIGAEPDQAEAATDD